MIVLIVQREGEPGTEATCRSLHELSCTCTCTCDCAVQCIHRAANCMVHCVHGMSCGCNSFVSQVSNHLSGGGKWGRGREPSFPIEAHHTCTCMACMLNIAFILNIDICPKQGSWRAKRMQFHHCCNLIGSTHILVEITKLWKSARI